MKPPAMPPDALRTNGTAYTLFKISAIVGADGKGELTPVFTAPILTEIFEAIVRLGLAGKPHVIAVSLTLISPFAPAATTPEPERQDRPPGLG